MKTKLLLLAFAFCVAFSSCTKDNDETPGALTGTSWMYSDADEILILSFTTSVQFTYTDVGYGTYQGIYSYTKPNVTLIFDGEKEFGTVNGKKMTFSDGMVFTRQ